MTHEQKPESAEFLRNARAMQAKVKQRLGDRAEFRTREAQIDEIYDATAKAVCRGRSDYPPEIYRAYLGAHIARAEARGAAEQRRKDAEGAVAWVDPAFLPSSDYPWTDARLLLEDGTKETIPLYSRPANVAALEARVKELEVQIVQSEKRAFNHGYLIACCNISHLHDEPSIACDVLAECGLSVGDVSTIELSDYDAEALSQIRASRGDRDPICGGDLS